MAIDSSTPVLTAVNATDPSFQAPNSSNVTCQSQYGMQTVWSGGGGTFEIRPYGNLLSLATLGNAGFPYLLTPGTEFVTLDITGGNGIGISQSGRNFIISVVPNTTVQQVNVQASGTAVGTARSTINFIPGSGMGITGVDSGGITSLTFTSNGASSSAHFVTTQAESALPNEFNLGSLTSGILKQTVVSGVSTPAIALGNTDYMLANSKMIDLYNSNPSAGSLFYYVGGHWSSIAPGTVGNVLTSLTSTSIGWTSASAVLANWSVYPALQNVNFNGFKGIGLLDPTAAQDAATKNYVDLHAGGAPVGASYLVATANVSLTGEVNLGALATGVVVSTVASGIATISTVPQSSFQPASLSALVTTSDATPTTLVTIPVPSNTALTLEGIIVARNSTFTDSTGGFFNATAINNAGVVTLVGSPVVAVNATSTSSFNVFVSGTNLVITVTGIVSNTYDWKSIYSTSSL